MFVQTLALDAAFAWAGLGGLYSAVVIGSGVHLETAKTRGQVLRNALLYAHPFIYVDGLVRALARPLCWACGGQCVGHRSAYSLDGLHESVRAFAITRSSPSAVYAPSLAKTGVPKKPMRDVVGALKHDFDGLTLVQSAGRAIPSYAGCSSPTTAAKRATAIADQSLKAFASGTYVAAILKRYGEAV